MATFPSIAKIRLLPESATQARIVPTQVVLHTAVDAPGETDLHNYFARTDIGTESHFFIQKDGDIIQYIDTAVRADANFDANKRAISIETEDDGSTAPWTVEQVKSIKRLGEALMAEHKGILRRVAPAQDLPGWGYHALFDAWNRNKHSCPGGPRIHQFQTDITMWLRGQPLPVEDDMPSLAEVEDVFRKVLAEGTAKGQPSWAKTQQASFAMEQQTLAAVKKLQASGVDVEELAERIASKLDPENVSQATVEAGLRKVLGELDEDG